MNIIKNTNSNTQLSVTLEDNGSTLTRGPWGKVVENLRPPRLHRKWPFRLCFEI